jgi:hypothetical protein
MEYQEEDKEIRYGHTYRERDREINMNEVGRKG